MVYDPTDRAEVLSEHLFSNRHHKISNKTFHILSVRIRGHRSCSRFIYQPASYSLAFCQIKVQPDKLANIMKTGTGSTQDLNNEKFSIIINRSHVSITQLTSKCIYMHIVNKIATVPTAQKWFEHNLKPEQNQDSYDFDWNKIYMLPRKSTTDSRTLVFQYRLLNNVLLFQWSAV